MVGLEPDNTLSQTVNIGNDVLDAVIGDKNTHQFVVLVLGIAAGDFETDRCRLVQFDMLFTLFGYVDWSGDKDVALRLELGHFFVGYRLNLYTSDTLW